MKGPDTPRGTNFCMCKGQTCSVMKNLIEQLNVKALQSLATGKPVYPLDFDAHPKNLIIAQEDFEALITGVPAVLPEPPKGEEMAPPAAKTTEGSGQAGTKVDVLKEPQQPKGPLISAVNDETPGNAISDIQAFLHTNPNMKGNNSNVGAIGTGTIAKVMPTSVIPVPETGLKAAGSNSPVQVAGQGSGGNTIASNVGTNANNVAN